MTKEGDGEWWRTFVWTLTAPLVHGGSLLILGALVWQSEATSVALAARTTHDQWHLAHLVLWSVVAISGVALLGFVLFVDDGFKRSRLILLVLLAAIAPIALAAVLRLAQHEALPILDQPGTIRYPSPKLSILLPEALVSVAVAGFAAALSPDYARNPPRVAMWLAFGGVAIGSLDPSRVVGDPTRFDRNALLAAAVPAALLVAAILEVATRREPRERSRPSTPEKREVPAGP